MVDDHVRAMDAYDEEQERLSNQEAEENELLAPPEKTYREDICLESKPNILFLDCKHIAICAACDSMKRHSTCDVCRAEISRRLKI